MSKTPAKPVTGAPALGQHTKEVLADLLGIREPELSDLFAAGTVTGPSE
jgi:crotonobetainyl-CoA:carnitine CoA-transferase CaiB-like acyl-CoA transferase